MSTGLVICSECSREVHQERDHQWRHCRKHHGGTPICDGGKAIYPTSRAAIIGAYCGADGTEYLDARDPEWWQRENRKRALIAMREREERMFKGATP